MVIAKTASGSEYLMFTNQKSIPVICVYRDLKAHTVTGFSLTPIKKEKKQEWAMERFFSCSYTEHAEKNDVRLACSRADTCKSISSSKSEEILEYICTQSVYELTATTCTPVYTPPERVSNTRCSVTEEKLFIH